MPGSQRIKGKIVLGGRIECLSPVHVGNSRAEHSDMDIVRDCEGRFYIPATSFTGVLRHAFRKCAETQDKEFWGYADNDESQQSAFCCSDLTPVGWPVPEIITRDGIRISGETGIVEPQGKYDYELLERGARFRLNMEFTYTQENESFVKRAARTIHDLLANGRIRIGAKTNSGFGRIVLVENATKLYLFDFSAKENGARRTSGSAKEDVLRWLKQDFKEHNLIPLASLGEPFNEKRRTFSISAQLRLKSSLIVRSSACDSKAPDTVQLTSREDWVIPGTSLRGALRARAERIVKTLGLPRADGFINELFGHVENKNRSKGSRKGSISIEEIRLLTEDFPAEAQTRIRIDRFTGGVIEGGLFDSMPIFAPRDDKIVGLNMEVDDFKDCQAGLLLLVLKDLWSGDLAIGGEKGIGRGVFQGERAEIVWDDQKIMIGGDISTLAENEKAALQGFVAALYRELD